MTKNYKRLACRFCFSLALRAREKKLAHQHTVLIYDCCECSRSDVVNYSHSRIEKQQVRRLMAGPRYERKLLQ